MIVFFNIFAFHSNLKKSKFKCCYTSSALQKTADLWKFHFSNLINIEGFILNDQSPYFGRLLTRGMFGRNILKLKLGAKTTHEYFLSRLMSFFATIWKNGSSNTVSILEPHKVAKRQKFHFYYWRFSWARCLENTTFY